MMRISANTIARTVCLILALVNQCLAIFGKEALPFAEDTVYQFISLTATIAASLVAWWKNNSFTKPAIEADAMMQKLKDTKKD